MDLIEGDSYTYFCVLEQIIAVHPDNFAALNAGELSFFLCQRFSPWEIELHVIACPDWCRNRQSDKNSGFTDVAASAVKEPIGFRNPNTDWPGNFISIVRTLLN